MAESKPSAKPTRLPPWVWDVLGVAALLAVLTGLSIRQSYLMVIPDEPQRSHEIGRNGLADFRDVIYYPLQAVREGINPYDCGTTPLADGTPRYRQRYPVLNLFPLYSPLLFVLYWPFADVDFTTSAVLYVILNVALLLVFALVAWRCAGVRPRVAHVTMLASAILATQAGRANFLGGETAIPLALASVAAVTLAPNHPWLAGLALAMASFKPTFGLPLGILLLACQHYRTVALGWGLGFAIGLMGLGIIFANSGDLPRFTEILRENQRVLESDPQADAQHSSTRVDSAGALERLWPLPSQTAQFLPSLLVLGIAAVSLWRLSAWPKNPAVAALTTSLVCLTTVSSLYHVNYDAVLLWIPIVMVLFAPTAWWPEVTPRWRWLVGLLLLLPMINLLPTATIQRWLAAPVSSVVTIPPAWSDTVWAAICSLNGLALLAALILLAWRGCSLQRAATSGTTS